MKKARKELQPGERFFVGIGLHNNKWHVTVRTADLELFSGSIPGKVGSIKANTTDRRLVEFQFVSLYNSKLTLH
ncbi:MAG: hypothetical protein AMK70_04825 [Nitrospira bacterium SG8_35_1]|nr:MAG: hypothetical protein AMK70_04825 [Nitrospira bacterium SG8_35_1]